MNGSLHCSTLIYWLNLSVEHPQLPCASFLYETFFVDPLVKVCNTYDPICFVLLKLLKGLFNPFTAYEFVLQVVIFNCLKTPITLFYLPSHTPLESALRWEIRSVYRTAEGKNLLRISCTRASTSVAFLVFLCFNGSNCFSCLVGNTLGTFGHSIVAGQSSSFLIASSTYQSLSEPKASSLCIQQFENNFIQ